MVGRPIREKFKMIRSLTTSDMRKIFAITIMIFVLMSSPALGENSSRDSLKEAKELSETVVKLYKAGKYEQAIPYAKKSLDLYEKALGKENSNVATGVDNLATLYWNTARYAEAEPLFKRALAIREKVLGKEHPDVAHKPE